MDHYGIESWKCPGSQHFGRLVIVIDGKGMTASLSRRKSGVLDGWLGGWLVPCCDVSGTMVTLVYVDGVVGSVGSWSDVTDVVVIARVVVVGTGSPTYLTLKLCFLRTSFGLGRVVGFVVGFGSSLMSESS